MKDRDVDGVFKDSQGTEQLKKAIDSWRLPLATEEHPAMGFWDISLWYRTELESTKLPRARNKIEKTLVRLLYEDIRLNIKRGRIFDLREVLKTGQADCLGYSKIFTTLGRLCGLGTGVAEVIVDNRGRKVPHTVSLVKLANGENQIVDLWYGSPDIRHKRLGLRVKRQGCWKIEDIDYSDLKKVEEISYLPDDRVDAITLYIEGNRSLKEGRYTQAIGQYTLAIGLYPENARVYYNRAIAHEKIGQAEKAKTDYTRALHDNIALQRTLAVQPQDIVDLIKLDEKFIPENDQYIYLLRRGFISGRPASPQKIAIKLSIPLSEVEASLNGTERLLES